ncbi:MAG TPA: hypothetical protein VKX40_12945 [Aequorivita sp.]|nr:hypothetical protein [Aequorivita sp.]
MKYLLLTLFVFSLLACNQQTGNTEILQNRIDSLETKIANSYKPGFGDFMSAIQAHHYKLWFAGQNENWDLADFEMHEIMEIIEDIQTVHAGRKETEVIGMIDPAIDSINFAIKKKDPTLFKSRYNSLTIACNKCHRETDHGFIVVKIPDASPFGNQDFSARE